MMITMTDLAVVEGTGRLWLDLGDRAEQTSTELLFR